ncbi:hypothetical protein EII34_13140 [Arachnia propionica]|uniref:Uncharacterized protein n=1 Tax=Arachnia propionica TaxID=1750 RepID=A0A3P1T2N1_9ACTN|nr:hypothetical protein [Arachnia propionica]RRD03742.1 hypothetical protein EII34_13140 [Arachnia propionica]
MGNADATRSSHHGRRGVVLVLGGTGMLRPAVEQLLREGEQVVVVARHASRAVAGMPEGATAVDADWVRPAEYGQRCRVAVAGREVCSVILWVHQPHRDAVTMEIDPLLTDATRVVRLWGSASGDPRAKAMASHEPRTGDLCDVYLGSSGGEWLTHEQISQAAVTALRGSSRELVVGDLRALP